jgi:hypothetical protein
MVYTGNTKGGSITVLLTSCLTGLESAVWQLTTFCFYWQNRLIQTSQIGGQRYSDTSPFSIPWFYSIQRTSLFHFIFRRHEVKVHTTEKRRTCHVCGKVFSDAAAVKRHVKVSAGGVSLEAWDQCYKTFYGRKLQFLWLARAFIPGRFFQSTLLLVSKARSLP